MAELDPNYLKSLGDPRRKLKEAILLEAAAEWKAACPSFCDVQPKGGLGWACKGCRKHTHMLVKPLGYEGRGVCLSCFRQAVANRDKS